MNAAWQYRRNGHQALALIVVVYVLASLGTLMFALAFRSRIGLYRAQLLTDRVRQDEIAVAACTRACRFLMLDDAGVDSYDDAWAGWHVLESTEYSGIGRDVNQVWWRLVDESGKINVNLAPLDVLAGVKGLDQAAVASILDWIDEDDFPNPDGAEQEYYARLSDGRACKNAPFENVEELALVKGISGDLYLGTRETERLENLGDLTLEQTYALEDEGGSPGLAELLTVYGDGKINLNTAPPGVLRAIPLLSESAVAEILSRQRSGARKLTSLQDIASTEAFEPADKVVLSQIARFNSAHFQLQVRSQTRGMSSVYEYTAILERDGAAVRVLSWQRKLRWATGD